MAEMHAVKEEPPKSLEKLPTAPLSFMPASWDEAWRVAQYLEKSGLTPDALRGKVYDLLYIIATGNDLALSPMQSVREIVIIKGKPYLSALLRVSLVKQSPLCEYFRLVESTATRAVFETKRKGEGVSRMEFTADDARRAQLLDRKDRDGKPITDDNWSKYLPLMLRRRCASQLADEVYPDVTRGTHDKEDIDEMCEVEGTATVTRIGLTVAPPSAEEPPSPEAKPSPPKSDSAPPPAPSGQMSEFDQICASLQECQTVEAVDDLAMKHVGYKGGERQELARLFKMKRGELEHGVGGKKK